MPPDGPVGGLLDGIDPADEEHFNLVIQRIAPDTGLILDQEIFGRISCCDTSRNYIGNALPGSLLIRVQMPLPHGRPAATVNDSGGTEAAYVGHAQCGSDGGTWSDDERSGAALLSTGRFARDRIGHG